MKQGLVRLLYNFGKRFMGWTLHMIMCVLLCYPVSIRIYYQQGVLFLVQHRALTCLSKSLAHILQRELYSMANTSLLRHKAEMTLLQPQLGETRRQELRNSSFWDPSLFQSQLVKEGEDFLLKKGTSKDSQGFTPYQNKPFRGPHNKRRGSYRKHPYGGNSSQSSNQSFSSGRGKPNFRGSRGHFRPHNRGRGRGNPSSQ